MKRNYEGKERKKNRKSKEKYDEWQYPTLYGNERMEGQKRSKEVRTKTNEVKRSRDRQKEMDKRKMNDRQKEIDIKRKSRNRQMETDEKKTKKTDER